MSIPTLVATARKLFVPHQDTNVHVHVRVFEHERQDDTPPETVVRVFSTFNCSGGAPEQGIIDRREARESHDGIGSLVRTGGQEYESGDLRIARLVRRLIDEIQTELATGKRPA